MLQPERRRREGQGLPDVLRSIIPCFRVFSVFLVFLNSLVFSVVSTVLRVRCYLHLRWYYLYFGDNEEGGEFDRNLGGGIDKL